LKKRTKKILGDGGLAVARVSGSGPASRKSFLLLFFKKEALAFSQGGISTSLVKNLCQNG
jgi:hypothetical protein